MDYIYNFVKYLSSKWNRYNIKHKTKSFKQEINTYLNNINKTNYIINEQDIIKLRIFLVRTRYFMDPHLYIEPPVYADYLEEEPAPEYSLNESTPLLNEVSNVIYKDNYQRFIIESCSYLQFFINFI